MCWHKTVLLLECTINPLHAKFQLRVVLLVAKSNGRTRENPAHHLFAPARAFLLLEEAFKKWSQSEVMIQEAVWIALVCF